MKVSVRQAPVVKWISYPPSKRLLGVRIPPGAQNRMSFSLYLINKDFITDCG